MQILVVKNTSWAAAACLWAVDILVTKGMKNPVLAENWYDITRIELSISLLVFFLNPGLASEPVWVELSDFFLLSEKMQLIQAQTLHCV